MTDLYFPKSKISVKVEKLKFLACLEVCICKCRPVNNSKSQIEVRIRKCGPVNNSKGQIEVHIRECGPVNNSKSFLASMHPIICGLWYTIGF